tara:strand:+ start:4037 stop:4660 length:624 start_codon:yes stop_codon:yes gene_type:complete
VNLPKAIGALLVGGFSTRMGRPKAEVQLGRLSLATRASDTLSVLSTEVILVGGEPIDDLQHRHLPDARKDAGPAAGIETALSNASIHVVVLALDLPFVPPELLLETLAVVDQGAIICAPRWEGRWHPLCATYSQAALGPLRQRLDRGVFDLYGLLDEIATPLETDVLQEVGKPTEILLNINTPKDLSLAKKLLSAKSQEHRGSRRIN